MNLKRYNEPQKVSNSEPIPFCLGPWRHTLWSLVPQPLFIYQAVCVCVCVCVYACTCTHARGHMLSCRVMSDFLDSMDCSLPSSSVRGILQARSTGVRCHLFLQGIFLTQGLNPCLLHLLRWQAGGCFIPPPPGKPYQVGLLRKVSYQTFFLPKRGNNSRI